MNIARYRSSFTIAIIDADSYRGQKIYQALKTAGYISHQYISAEVFFEKVESSPPHILFLEQDTLIILGESFIDDVLNYLPEVHIIIYAKQEDLYSTSQFISRGVYDCVAYHEENLNFLVLSADRAAERDYFMYMNEQLQVEGGALGIEDKAEPVEANPPAFENREQNNSDHYLRDYGLWFSYLQEKKTLRETVEAFLLEATRILENKEIIYFKYVPSHSSLIVAQSVVRSFDKIRGLGLDLSKEEIAFSLDLLYAPEKIRGFKELVNKELNANSFVSLPLIVQGVPEGVFVFLNVDADQIKNTYLELLLKGLALKISQINLIKKLQALSIHDDKTRVLNRENFIVSVKKEISRAQRITLPLSLVVLTVDQAEEIEEDLNSYEQDILLKMCATILRRHSRVNDMIGRLDKFTFGIILPHTGKLGGAIKAERLRRIFESADFSKVTPAFRSITISVGVSEYPSHCLNHEDILKLADEALNEVKKTGRNKVCLASPPRGFVPDFIVDSAKL